MKEAFGSEMESYYGVLGLSSTSSSHDIRHAYRRLAMQWHPDKWAHNPAMLGEAKGKFQKIQEAYSVLSDPRKRTLYDAGIYDPLEEDVDEGFCDFMQEMVSLMSQVREEEKPSSMEEVQSMFAGLVQEFQYPPQWFSSPCVVSNHGILQQQCESFARDSDSNHTSNFGMFGMSSYCN